MSRLPGKNLAFPRDPQTLRTYIVKKMIKLPQAADWIENIFVTEKNFKEFRKKHAQSGEWTDAGGTVFIYQTHFLKFWKF